MAVLVALIVAALGWAVWKGKLRPAQLPPIIVGVAGAFLAARGNLIVGLGAVAIGTFWYRGMTTRLFRRNKEVSDPQAIDKARFILGVSRFDNADYIRERHSILIAKNNPESSGSADRTAELNKARDLLLRDVAQRDRKG